MLYKKIINNPLEKLTLGKKKQTTYYLTANIFYSGLHFAVRNNSSSTHGFVLERPMTPPTDGQPYTFEASTAIDRPEYDLG